MAKYWYVEYAPKGQWKKGQRAGPFKTEKEAQLMRDRIVKEGWKRRIYAGVAHSGSPTLGTSRKWKPRKRLATKLLKGY